METERLTDVNKNIGKKTKDNKKKNDKKDRKVKSNYFKDVVVELKKVSWPNRKDVTKATGVVIAITVALGVIVGLFDLLFSTLVNLIVG